MPGKTQEYGTTSVTVHCCIFSAAVSCNMRSCRRSMLTHDKIPKARSSLTWHRRRLNEPGAASAGCCRPAGQVSQRADIRRVDTARREHTAVQCRWPTTGRDSGHITRTRTTDEYRKRTCLVKWPFKRIFEPFVLLVLVKL